MEDKIVKIEDICPEGYEIDKERSTLEKLIFKLRMCYKSIAQELFKNNKTKYFINTRGCIEDTEISDCFWDLTVCTSEKQAKKLLAINQLMNVAKYLNKDWKPDWNNDNEKKYTISFDRNNKKINITWNVLVNKCPVYFKTEELAKKAIEILGEETIRLAFSTDW